MEPKKFYDIHFHAMDLSHANITAFINRFLQQGILGSFRKKKNKRRTCRGILIVGVVIALSLILWIPKLIWLHVLLSVTLLVLLVAFIILFFLPDSTGANWILSFLTKLIKLDNIISKKNSSLNLLSFMESAIEYDFLVLEAFLREKDPVLDKHDNRLTIGDTRFDKIVLCPLVMDFGYSNINNPHIFYNIPPRKPVALQTSDLFRAIRKYYTHTLSIEKTKEQGNRQDVPQKMFTSAETSIPKEERLFEIYPFMGLNTKNYSREETEAMLMKYFGDFDKKDTPEQRKRMLFEKMGQFDGNLDHEDGQVFKNIFAGIKLYPPLGFEPWPDKDQEREKVVFLYETCIDRNIPVITHCSTNGFLVNDRYRAYSDPSNQWAEVLTHYPQLKINFAHFGAGKQAWENAIKSYILNDAHRVYTDFSCNTIKDTYYERLAKQLEQQGSDKLEQRILFGTDFMIHLLWLESYNEYLHDFIRSRHLSEARKVRFASENPEHFLFS